MPDADKPVPAIPEGARGTFKLKAPLGCAHVQGSLSSPGASTTSGQAGGGLKLKEASVDEVAGGGSEGALEPGPPELGFAVGRIDPGEVGVDALELHPRGPTLR